MRNDDLLTRGALELAAMVRRGEVSPRTLVDAHVARIETVNPRLNAVVGERFAAARRDAIEAERRLREGDPAPLLGVPFTVKEMAGLEGLTHSAGSWHRRHVVCRRDGTVVSRLRAAGAIPLGVTNQPEMGLWVESANVVYGRANNPWDVRRSPGGSSGGEGAIIAAGGSPFGVASDAGGSIRLPAAYCGVFGHKPTSAIVPLTGHFPFVDEGDHPEHGAPPRYVVIGPIARSARDLMPLLRIMAGADGVDPYVTQDVALGDDASFDFHGKRVLLLDDPIFGGTTRARPEVRSAVRHAARILESRGAKVEPWSHPHLKEAMPIWRALFAEGREVRGGASTLAYGTGTVDLAREALRHLLGRPRHSAAALLLVFGERFGPRPKGGGDRRRARGIELRDDLERALGDDGVLLLPTHPRVAPRHHATFLRPLDWVYTGLFNVLDTPATAAPMGFDHDGMPLSVQIVAARHRDHVSIAAARAIEQELGGYRMAMR